MDHITRTIEHKIRGCPRIFLLLISTLLDEFSPPSPRLPSSHKAVTDKSDGQGTLDWVKVFRFPEAVFAQIGRLSAITAD